MVRMPMRISATGRVNVKGKRSLRWLPSERIKFISYAFDWRKNKKRPRITSGAFLYFVKKGDLFVLLLFLLEFFVLVLELIDPASGVHQFGLTGIERMRSH